MATTRTTPFVELSCDECGATYQLSTRNALRHRTLGTSGRCRDCRFAPQVTPAAVAEARAWWLSRFTLEELRSWPTL